MKVKLLGVFRGPLGRDQLLLKLENPTVRDVIQALAESFSPETKKLFVDPELNDLRSNVLVLLNGREINVLDGLETKVSKNDEVTLIPVAHGG